MTLVDRLSQLYAEVVGDAMPCGPGGHTIVPAALAETAERIWSPTGYFPRDRANERVRTVIAVEGATLIAIHCPHPAGQDPRTVSGRERGPAVAAWLHGLAALRLDLSSALLSRCVSYASRRRSGDAPLLAQQLVMGALAEALAEQLTVRAVLDGGRADERLLADAHRRVTAADRRLLPLLGASGFLADGPGQTAYVSELLADAALPGPLR
jgi:hypothetical protein